MLKLFFKNPEKNLYGLEIAQSLNASPGTIHRELGAMLAQGIITKKREGALVLYRLNTHHPHFFELKKVIVPKKKSQRVIFLSGLHLSLETPSDALKDLSLVLNYVEDNASHLVFLGNTLETHGKNPFETYLLQKPLFDRIQQLSHELDITIVPGESDLFFGLFKDHRFFDSPIHFQEEFQSDFFEAIGVSAYHLAENSGLEMRGKSFEPGHDMMKALSSLHPQGLSLYQNKLLSLLKTPQMSDLHQKSIDAFAKSSIEKRNFAYVVIGTEKASVKKLKHGIFFTTGSFQRERSFVEIDEEGGALVFAKDLS